MTSDIFLTTEQVIINAIKAQILTLTQSKQIFWNGVENDCVIAGGVFASLINCEAIKDIDVFVLNMNTQVYNHLTNFSNGDQWQIRDAIDAPHYLKNSHIHGTALNTNTKVQYILTDYTTREELLKDFDYKHTTVSYVPKEMKLYITRGAFDAIRNKELIVNGNKEPKAWRMEKFVKRGWRTSAIDHHIGLLDSYQQTIQQSVADMIKRINQQKSGLPAEDDNMDAFRKLLSE